MRHLLDTHSFIWFVDDDPMLSGAARAVIADPQNTLMLSVASVWEMAIKIGLGKLSFAQPFEVFLPEQLHRNRIDLLPILPEHAIRVATLPHHHRDPFDRLLIAQALVGKLPLISRDPAFDAYGVQRVW